MGNLTESKIVLKRDIVDTYPHASRAPCHNTTKQMAFPTMWEWAQGKKERIDGTH